MAFRGTSRVHSGKLKCQFTNCILFCQNKILIILKTKLLNSNHLTWSTSGTNNEFDAKSLFAEDPAARLIPNESTHEIISVLKEKLLFGNLSEDWNYSIRNIEHDQEVEKQWIWCQVAFRRRSRSSIDPEWINSWNNLSLKDKLLYGNISEDWNY